MGMVTTAFAALLTFVAAIPFARHRNDAVRAGKRERLTGGQRALVAASIAVNTIPFAPIWPRTSGGDGFL
jgi:hypothetical protein